MGNLKIIFVAFMSIVMLIGLGLSVVAIDSGSRSVGFASAAASVLATLINIVLLATGRTTHKGTSKKREPSVEVESPFGKTTVIEVRPSPKSKSAFAFAGSK